MTIKILSKIPYSDKEGKPLEKVSDENSLNLYLSEEIIDNCIDEFVKAGEIFLDKNTHKIYLTRRGSLRLMMLTPDQSSFREKLMDNPSYINQEF